MILRYIVLTNTGIRFQCQSSDPEELVVPHIEVLLESGTSVLSGGGTGTPTEDGSGINYSYQWNVPIDLQDVVGVKFWNTEIYFEILR